MAARGMTATEIASGSAIDEAGVAKFKQTPDARAGATCVVFQGKFYASFKDLPPEAALYQTGKGKARAGQPRAELWPEMPQHLRPGIAPLEEEGLLEVTGGGPAPGDGYTAEDLAPLSKAQLAELAEARGLAVAGKRRNRPPTRQDYLAVLIGR